MVVPRSRHVFSLALVVLLSISVMPSFGSPPPRPVCTACGDGFVESAEIHGVSVDVEHSTAVVRVHENGSATWIIRNRIDDDTAKRLRGNPSLLTSIAEDVHTGGDLLDADISATGVVTIRYRMEEFAVSSVGNVLISEYLTEFSYQSYGGLGADRLTVVAPESMRIGHAMTGASVHGRRMTLTNYTDGAFVTFVPGGTIDPILSFLAIVTVNSHTFSRNILVFVGLPSIVFAIVIGILIRILSRYDRELSRVRPYGTTILVTFGILACLVSLGSSFPLFGLGTGLVLVGAVIWILTACDRVTYRTLVGSAVLAVVVASALAENNSLLLGLAMFALVPAGYALGQGYLRRSIVTGTLGFIALLAQVAPLDTPTLGLSLLFVFFSGMYALALALLGSPLLAIGASYSANTEL